MPGIRRALNTEIPALVAEGKVNEAATAIDDAQQDLRDFAASTGVPLWDNSVAILLRLADSRRAALLDQKSADGASQDGDDSTGESDATTQPTGRLTAEQARTLSAIRGDLAQVSTMIRGNKLAPAQTAIYNAQEQINRFVADTKIPEWNRAVAAVFQLAATRQTELDAKRGAEESRAAALAAEAARRKTVERTAADVPRASSGLAAGQFAPPFVASTVEGEPLVLQQYRGKWVLLDFWATWCGPCKGEVPYLKDLYATYGGDKRFAMISLSIDNQVADPLNYARQNELQWVQGFLGQGWASPVLKAYSVRGIPAIFLIAPDGRVFATGLRGERIKAVVAGALARK